MYESLVKKGFTNNKSFDCKVPDLKSNLLRHFMRGYYDGDGCLSLTDKSFNVGFTTASKFLNDDLIRILKSQKINFTCGSYVTEFDTQMYTISINRKEDKFAFLNWIYGDCLIYLDRKYKKYLQAKKTLQ